MRSRSAVAFRCVGMCALTSLAFGFVVSHTDPQLHAAEPMKIEPMKIEPIKIQYMWEVDPNLDIDWWPERPTLLPESLDSRLESPRVEVRFAAAQSLLRFSEHPSLDKLKMSRALIARLEHGEPESSVRLGMVSALCQLGSAEDANRLWNIGNQDGLVLPTIEKALTHWKQPYAVQLWRNRLLERKCTEQELTRACAGLGSVGTQDDLANLSSLVSDGTQSATVRLVAAQAIGELSDSSQLRLAQSLRASPALHTDLFAISVLGRQSDKTDSDATQQFVFDVAEHGSLLAQRAAYRWICDMIPEEAQARARDFFKRDDSEIRRLSLLQVNRTDHEDAIPVLVAALRDSNSNLRQIAREQLLVFANRSDDHEQRIKDVVGPEMAKDDWRSIAECIRLAVELRQPQHAVRILELLDHPRVEVSVKAAWALSHLGTEESVLAKMLEHASYWTKRMQSKVELTPPINEYDFRRIGHLLEGFGVHRYTPAQSTLILYVPRKEPFGLISRITGTWAAGKMWEDEKNEALAKELCARIADKNNLFPEAMSVRFVATIALGFLSDRTTREALVVNDEPGNPIGYATTWALERLDSR